VCVCVLLCDTNGQLNPIWRTAVFVCTRVRLPWKRRDRSGYRDWCVGRGTHRRRGLVVVGDFRCSRWTTVECGPAYELHTIILLLYLYIYYCTRFHCSCHHGESIPESIIIYYILPRKLCWTHFLHIVILRLSKKKKNVTPLVCNNNVI
jgi:hypothetical protein